jgi:acetolactate synthase-1/3 small subunit
MNATKNSYIITTYVENKIGILYRVINVFSRRMINVESLTVVETERKGISKVTIVIDSTENVVKQLIKHIEKQIGVLSTMLQSNNEIAMSKVSLYKMFTQSLANHDDQLPVLDQTYVN